MVLSSRARLLGISLVLLALVSFTLVLPAGATESGNSAWAVRVWRTDEGLPSNYVTGLAQTPDGYLWVSTYLTPARFDGVHFEENVFTDLPDVRHEKITALARKHDGGLWMGALHGAVFLLDSKRVQSVVGGLPDKQVQALTEDAEGALWISYPDGNVCRIKEGQVATISAADGLPNEGTSAHTVC